MDRKILISSRWSSRFNEKPSYERGDRLPAYIFLQNKQQTIVYVPAYNKLMEAKIDGRKREDIWNIVSGWSGWEFYLPVKERKRVKEILGC